ncbi:MAG: EamA family transporter [Dethiobacter sp.]|jgi:drug/metabolite transporter (DMT)-like permease|nr:EamA family transporter [Dethiobacter sp.]
MAGLRQIEAGKVGIIATVEPLSAALLSFLFLQQSLNNWQLFGFALILISVILLSMPGAVTGRRVILKNVAP